MSTGSARAGALCHYVSHAESKNYQPTNIAFGLLPALEPHVKNELARNEALVARALSNLDGFVQPLEAPDKSG